MKPEDDVFALCIGSFSGMNETKSHVSTSLSEYPFAIDGFQDLKKLLDEIEVDMADVSCAPFDLAK